MEMSILVGTTYRKIFWLSRSHVNGGFSTFWTGALWFLEAVCVELKS